MKIIPASITDADEILEIQKLAYQSEAERYNDYNIPPLTQTLEEMKEQFKSHLFLKAVLEGEIVGTVRAREENGTCYVGRLAVHPRKQNQGIGSALMKEIENAFSSGRFELFVGAKSDKDIYIYNKLGYKTFKSGTEGCGQIHILYMEKSRQATNP